jgi:very-short-patch-repair endonuclease
VVLADVQRRREGGRVRDSWFEALVERLVRSAKVPEVVRQYEIVDAQGRFVARVDLAIPSLRIAIEAHSRRFHTGPAREARDEHRDHAITGQGWVTMYLGWADTTRSPAAVIRRVEQLVAVRTSRLRAG